MHRKMCMLCMHDRCARRMCMVHGHGICACGMHNGHVKGYTSWGAWYACGVHVHDVYTLAKHIFEENVDGMRAGHA